MSIKKALEIDGWMSEFELEWLAKEAKKHKVIVEIGSYVGRSTRALGDNTKGVVYAIDDFKGPRDVAWTNRPTQKDILAEFDKNLGDLVDKGRVIPVIADHREIEADIEPDMVFLDGSHDYIDVKDDIMFWLPKMKPGSLLCGHDYGAFIGVTEVVNELFDDAVLAGGTTIWFKII